MHATRQDLAARTSFLGQRGGFASALSASTGASSGSSTPESVRPAVSVCGRTRLGSCAVSGAVNQSPIGSPLPSLRLLMRVGVLLPDMWRTMRHVVILQEPQGLVGVHRSAQLAGDDL